MESGEAVMIKSKTNYDIENLFDTQTSVML
jgi:hypothetical protein